MRYIACSIGPRSQLSLSACEFRDTSPLVVPQSPSYGLLPGAKAKEKPRLYCVRDIERDEVVTTNPVQVIPKREVPFLCEVGLEDLCFDWNFPGKSNRYAVALGAGAFIGHSEEPNCYWKADEEKRTVTILPRRPIFRGEQLTIDYSTAARRPCAPVTRCEVNRLPARQLPKPELPKAVVMRDPSYGRTLIAVKNIRRGESIAEAPARVISNRKLAGFGKITMLTDLAHTWLERFAAVVLGIPAFVNHSYTANAFYDQDPKRRTISLIAHRAIAAGSEITMNYHGHPNDKAPLEWTSTERPVPLVVPLSRVAI